MVKVEVKNKQSQVITNQASFNTMDEVNAWIAECEKVEAFGKPEHVVYPEVVPDDEPASPILVPAEYDIIIDENYVDQSAINAEALAYLASTDWLIIRQQETGALVPEDVLEARRLARERVVR